MYQIKENITEHKEGDQIRTEYSYEEGWYETPIDSSNFDNKEMQNPSNTWPFKSETLPAQNVTMGKYRLNAAQIAMLGKREESVSWEDDGETAINNTADVMTEAGFAAFQMRGNYLYSSTDDNEEVGAHVGQYRIKFHYCPCSTVTIMAQQVQDDEDQYTFRKWNPEKKMVPYGQSTDGEQDSTCGNPLCCYICLCVNCLFNTMFEEVVDVARDGKLVSEQYFTEQESLLGGSATAIRWGGIFLCILGHYLLFAPIINLLNMIPFVGWLLSWIVAVAAVIFAVVVGLTLSVLTIAVAWVFFRPLIGIPLLILVGVSVYLTFFFDWSKVSKNDVADGGSDADATVTDDSTTPDSNDGTTVST